MTRAELRAQARELAGRPADYPRLTDAQLDQYIMEGVVRFAQETLPPALLDIVDVAITSGTPSYVVASAPLRIVSLHLGAVALVRESLQRIFASLPGWQQASNATPTHWLYMGRTAGDPGFRLYPTPSASATIKAVVLKKPAAIPSSGSIAEWDDLEQNAFAYYAAWRHLQNKTEVDQDDHAGKMMQNYQGILDLYRRVNGVDSVACQTAASEAAWRTAIQPGAPQQ